MARFALREYADGDYNRHMQIPSFGELIIVSLQRLTRFFNKMALAAQTEDIEISDLGSHAVTLLQLIPGGNESRDAAIEELEEKLDVKWKNQYKLSVKRQRQLADFKSYLRFNEVIDAFWLCADAPQKLFYFPLYFWWKLTAILPLRPMELLLTPRDCLRVCNEESILTVRRSKLKGNFNKVDYRIANDYMLKEYTINTGLAYEVERYIAMTENMNRTELGTLFAQEPHFKYTGFNGHIHNRYYTYQMLTTCLRYFYEENIHNQPLEIAPIRLGDTAILQ